MLKKLLTMTVLGVITTSMLSVAGCASENNRGEYGLTGNNDQTPNYNQDRDVKGHYRSDWRDVQTQR